MGRNSDMRSLIVEVDSVIDGGSEIIKESNGPIFELYGKLFPRRYVLDTAYCYSSYIAIK